MGVASGQDGLVGAPILGGSLPFPPLLPYTAHLVALEAVRACPLILDASLPEKQYAVALVSVDIAVGYGYVLYPIYRNPGCIRGSTSARLYGGVR